jgi:ubiquinone/menaquinone biosynthesis C-methylase UbiE
MSNFNRTSHWEKIYQTKSFEEVSWYQKIPSTSLDFVKQLNLPNTSKIIDIGGGDSYFVDYLLEEGYTNITVLDISEQALNKAKKRLGSKAEKVKWIVADAASIQSSEKYDLWHDRATFHFLTSEKEIDSYVNSAGKGVKPKGYLVIGTFSENGPKKCSGLTIKQYSERSMTDRLKKLFNKIKCITVDHETPSGSIQNFIFCSFTRLKTASY